jgi:hypothetical protein
MPLPAKSVLIKIFEEMLDEGVAALGDGPPSLIFNSASVAKFENFAASHSLDLQSLFEEAFYAWLDDAASRESDDGWHEDAG